MSYSLNAFMPFEGFSLTFTCEKGTLVANLAEKLPPGGERMEIVVRKTFSKAPPVVERPPAEEGHGGGDQRLRDLIFRERQHQGRRPPHGPARLPRRRDVLPDRDRRPQERAAGPAGEDRRSGEAVRGRPDERVQSPGGK